MVFGVLRPNGLNISSTDIQRSVPITPAVVLVLETSPASRREMPKSASRGLPVGVLRTFAYTRLLLHAHPRE